MNTSLIKALAVLILLTTVAPMTHAKDKPDFAGGSIEVEMVGVIRTGVMAIGGESTGTTVAALGFTWELDLGGNKDFEALARQWDGKELVVKGTVTVREGVERGRRVIVVVKKLMPLTK